MTDRVMAPSERSRIWPMCLCKRLKTHAYWTQRRGPSFKYTCHASKKECSCFLTPCNSVDAQKIASNSQGETRQEKILLVLSAIVRLPICHLGHRSWEYFRALIVTPEISFLGNNTLKCDVQNEMTPHNTSEIRGYWTRKIVKRLASTLMVFLLILLCHSVWTREGANACTEMA